jgi:hypothetical protein
VVGVGFNNVGWAGFIQPNIGRANASMLKIVIGSAYGERCCWA